MQDKVLAFIQSIPEGMYSVYMKGVLRTVFGHLLYKTEVVADDITFSPITMPCVTPSTTIPSPTLSPVLTQIATQIEAPTDISEDVDDDTDENPMDAFDLFESLLG
jgi:hypothetical protein